ncbi:hypothetical protein EUA62_00020 [TM7 phylum sp. oral taxon 348]|nr:hypothetical protein EUA62_00020 [TM7 phylum sp. oral taxon 348]
MALPKNKETKAIIEKCLSQRFNSIMRHETRPFNESPHIIQHEGKVLKHNTLDDQDSQKTMEYRKAEFTYKPDPQQLISMTLEDVIKLLDEEAKNIGSQMAKHYFQVLSITAEEVGNVVDAKDQKLTPEIFLDAMRKISIPFDKDGNPKFNNMIVSEEMSDVWKNIIEEAEVNPKHKEEFNKIIEQKRKEYNAEQAGRKLVD